MSGVEYRNWWSRVLLKPFFVRQTLELPQRASRLTRPVWLFEKLMMRIDVSEIQIDRPIFVVGVARSGTSMLQDILCAHSDVAFFTNAMNEFPSCFCGAEKLRRLFKLDLRGERFQKDGIMIGAGSPNEGSDLWRHVLKTGSNPVPTSQAPKKKEPRPTRIFATKKSRSHRPPFDLEPVGLDNLCDSQIDGIHDLIRRTIWCFAPPHRRFLNKTLMARRLLPVLQQLYPDCRVVHIVRDPRHSVNSIVKMQRLASEHRRRVLGLRDNSPDDFQDNGEEIRQASRYWNNSIGFIQRMKLDTNNILEVRYEDIVAEPKFQIEKIREFCELAEVSDRSSDYWRLIEQIGRTRHKSSYGNFELIESICSQNMQIYEYQMSRLLDD